MSSFFGKLRTQSTSTAMTTSNSADWTAYSSATERMADQHPAYPEIIERGLSTVRAWGLPPGSRIVDVGAGVGNFSVSLARALPQCTVIHLDYNAGMCNTAAAEAAQHCLANHQVLCCDVHTANFLPGTIAGIVSVHGLHAMAEPPRVIALMADWLSPGGRVFACDAGRIRSFVDWIRCILGEKRKQQGWLATSRLLWGACQVARNRRIARSQAEGRFWRHNQREFRSAFERCGLQVEKWYTCGGSDIVVACKPAPSV